MATAAPHVKLLRQLASAKDDYLSGAFDISWDGAKATLYLVFGRPSHAVFDTDKAQIEGEAAIDALLAELPRTFAVSDWRRAMSPQETLSITIDELAGPFVRLAGSYADDPVSDENPEWWSADDSSPDLAFGLSDFPLLPGGRPLWVETSPESVNLAERLAELPPSILILTGAKLRAAAVVSGGDLIDAVWIDDEDQARGEAAGMAILGATKGTLAGYALDDPRVAEALTMLWRLPLAVSGIEMAWLDPASMLAAFRADGLDRVLVIDAPVRGIALFSRGGLVAVYSETQRSAVASPERLRSLLSQARGRLTVMERKPRPVAATSAHAAPSATDFFGVAIPEAEHDVAEPNTSDDGAAAEHDAHVASGPDVDYGSGEVAQGAVETSADEAAATADTSAPETSAVSEDTTAPEATVASEDASAPETSADSSETAAADATAVSHDPTAPETSAVTEDTTSSETTPAPEMTTVSDDATAAGDVDTLPPPPPPAHVDPTIDHAPPPAAADTTAEPAPKKKRAWWAFGGSRKKKAQQAADAAAQQAAADTTAAQEAEAASFSGWSVRQPNPEPQPVWLRSRDQSEGAGSTTATGTEPPPAEPEAPSAADETPATAASWSVVEPRSTVAHEPEPAAETEGTAEAEPAQTWSAREVIADSVGWYNPPASAVQPSADDAHDAQADHEPTAGDAHDLAAEADHEDFAADADHEPAAASDQEPDDDDSHQLAVETDHEPAAASDQEPDDDHSHQLAAETDHEPAAASDEAPADDGAHQLAAEADQEPAPASDEAPADDDAHQLAAEAVPEPTPASDEAPEAETDHEDVHDATQGADHEHLEEPAADASPEPDASVAAQSATAHDFWAEFATPDPDAVTEHESDESAASTTQHESDRDAEAAPATHDADHVTRKPSERTVAPWSWPLAEDESSIAAASSAGRHTTHDDEDPLTTGSHPDSAAAELETNGPSGGEQGFFQRDEPVGSQFVDFDEVRKELVQIGVVWLGETNAVPVTALLKKTRSTIDDFVATIDTIRGLHLEGQDPASVQAMAREMHQQAAERLCGA